MLIESENRPRTTRENIKDSSSEDVKCMKINLQNGCLRSKAKKKKAKNGKCKKSIQLIYVKDNKKYCYYFHDSESKIYENQLPCQPRDEPRCPEGALNSYLATSNRPNGFSSLLEEYESTSRIPSLCGVANGPKTQGQFSPAIQVNGIRKCSLTANCVPNSNVSKSHESSPELFYYTPAPIGGNAQELPYHKLLPRSTLPPSREGTSSPPSLPVRGVPKGENHLMPPTPRGFGGAQLCIPRTRGRCPETSRSSPSPLPSIASIQVHKSAPPDSPNESSRIPATIGGRPLPANGAPKNQKRFLSFSDVDVVAKIPESGDLTVNELREMATRQQQHIESQQQLLVAREQRLKYLKQQEGRTSQVNMETERLRRLRERVEAQEAKLRRLRALRGQVDSSRQNAASLYSDLDAMRHLFSEKEKELVDAAAKVEELTRQLEDVRGGRGVVSGTQNGGVTTPSQLQIHHQELEKLRRELLYRNSVNREASTRVASQRDALTTRKEEIVRIDKRIAELTQRLHRKRVLNQQLTTQISAATQAKQAQLKAVQQKTLREGKNDHSADNVNMEELRTLEDISQFDRGKHDPKYQTLPYNTKFSSGVKGPVPGPGSGPRHPYENSGMDQDLCSPSSDSNQSQSVSVVNNIRNSGFVSSTTTSSASSNSNNNATNSNSNAGVITRTVHSIPAHLASKGHALAPGQSSNSTVIPASTTHNSLVRGQNSIAGGSSSPIKQNNLSNQLYQQKGQPEQLGQQVPVTSSIQDIRANLPPTSLSASFSQKMVPGVSAHVQNRNIVGPPVHPQQTNINKDVENVRALGYPAGSSMMPSSQPVTSYQTSNSSSASQLPSSNSTVTTSKTNSSGGPSLISSTGELKDENSDTIIGKLKPVLPPKPVVPSKPTPPPRQKGDPLASSTESLNLIGVSNHRPSSSIRPQVFRYASQNVILSTYTQQQQQQQNIHHQPVSSAREPQVNKPSPGANVNLINQLNDKQNNDSSKGSQPKPSSKDGGESIGEDNLSEKVHISSNRRIEMPPDFLFPEDATPPSDLLGHQLEDFIRDRSQMEGRGGRQADEQNDAQPPSESQSRQIEQISSVASSVDQGLRLTENSKSEISENNSLDTTDRVNITNHNNVQNNNISNTLNNCANNLNVINNNVSTTSNEMERLRINNSMMEGGEKGDNEKEHIKMAEEIESNQPTAPSSNVVRRLKKGNLKTTNSSRAAPRRVSFDPLALLLDASLEGELELVKRTATEVPNPSAANDEGITALHNAICAGHLDIVTFLVTFGCDVNAQDSDGWTPLHCAASCNNVSMVRFLVEHGACVLATTLSDHETAAEKCEQDEEGYDGCSQYLYSVQEKLGIMNGGAVYAVYDYDSQNDDELSFKCGDSLTVIRRGDEYEREWWWVRINDKCGYVPRNLLGLCPRVKNPLKVS